MSESQASMLEIFVRYLNRTKPLTMIFHLFWILSICSILSVCYVTAFHFTSLVHIYDEAHNIKEFNHGLKLSGKTDTEINNILNKALVDLHANRAYLFRYHNGLAAVGGVPFFFQTNTHETISPGTSRLMQFNQRIPASLTPVMNQKFSQNECIVVNHMDHDNDMQILYFYQARQSKAMVRCPIFMDNGDLIGFVGIDYISDQDLQKLETDKVEIGNAALTISKIFASIKK
jgi:hypothetical protein